MTLVTTEAENTAAPETTTASVTTAVATAETVTPPKSTTAAETNEEGYRLASDFTVLDEAGNEVKLSDFFGKPIIINFWATWCEPCKSELPAFDSVRKEYGDKVTILMVNLTDGSRDTVESVKAFVADNGYEFPVYFDTEQSAAEAYGLYSIPVSVYIDSKGTIYGISTGAMSEDVIKRHLDDLLAEEAE